MAMSKIRRDDEVIVLAGKDKGKRGKVLKIVDGGRVIVGGIQLVKKHQKTTHRISLLFQQLTFIQNFMTVDVLKILLEV